MKKICVLLYHKNARILFKSEWIEKCLKSIRNQTYQDFDVLELNYGQTGIQLYKDSIFEQKMLQNHVEAMNYLINIAKEYYDYIFNVNIDDYYALNRIEEQLKYLEHYDLVASDYVVIKDKKDKEILIGSYENSKLDIKQNLDENNNIIAHPSVCWRKSFFDNLKYENEIPEEDMRLWQRAIKQNKRIIIIPEKLLFYRIHDNQITQMTQQNNADIMAQCLLDFIHIFEPSKNKQKFLRWSDITRIFESWWKHFHPEKKLPTQYDLRRTIDHTIGDPIPRRGWFVKIRKDYKW